MRETLTIKHWAEDDRPREKLQKKGKSALSDAELLAIIIGSGTKTESAVDVSKRILNDAQNNLNILGKKSIKELCITKGIGSARAIAIIAALELGKRHKISEILDKKQITSSNDAYELFYPQLADLDHEEFWVAYLNKANKVICTDRISIGGVDGTVIDVKIIMKKAIDNLATSIILCHNHPSGNLKASSADLAITKKLKNAASFFDIAILDHIIVGDSNYLSFVEEQLL